MEKLFFLKIVFGITLGCNIMIKKSNSKSPLQAQLAVANRAFRSPRTSCSRKSGSTMCLSPRSFILILSLILFTQAEQFFEPLHSVSFQLSRIHQLPIVAKPIQVKPTLQRVIFWRITLIGFNKRNHFFIFIIPYLVLCHFIQAQNVRTAIWF